MCPSNIEGQPVCIIAFLDGFGGQCRPIKRLKPTSPLAPSCHHLWSSSMKNRPEECKELTDQIILLFLLLKLLHKSVWITILKVGKPSVKFQLCSPFLLSSSSHITQKLYRVRECSTLVQHFSNAGFLIVLCPA